MLGIAITGLAILSVGGVGIGASFWFEIKTGEPIWMAGMKIASVFLGVGGILIGLGVSGMG